MPTETGPTAHDSSQHYVLWPLSNSSFLNVTPCSLVVISEDVGDDLQNYTESQSRRRKSAVTTPSEIELALQISIC